MSALSTDLILYSPEIIISITLCFALIIQMISRNTTLTFLTVLTGLLIAGVSTFRLYSFEPQPFFSNLLSHDPFSLFFKLLFILATLFTFLFSFRSYEIDEQRHSEFYLMTLAVLVGMTTLASSVNLLSLYLSLELVSIVSYALSGFRKEHPASNEAAIKYLLYGAMASGTMLFGLSLLYGLTGTLNLYLLKAGLASSYIDPLSLHAIFIMLLFGFGFKMAFVPFHMWAPDVYQGAPIPTTAFFTVAPKAAGFAIFIRFFYTVFANPVGNGSEWVWFADLNWPLFLSIASALTMTVGNLSALFQKNAKRMLAYSSIAHAGYMMLGLVTLTPLGISAVLFYMVVYFFMNFGAFFIVGLIGNIFKDEKISHFKGLGWKSPLVAISMAIFLLSLTGIPPLGGFIGKVYLFSALVQKEIYWLLMVAIINTVISLYYYAYIIREMFLEKPENEVRVPLSPLHAVSLILLVIPTLLLGIYWEPLMTFVTKSIQFG